MIWVLSLSPPYPSAMHSTLFYLLLTFISLIFSDEDASYIESIHDVMPNGIPPVPLKNPIFLCINNTSQSNKTFLIFGGISINNQYNKDIYVLKRLVTNNAETWKWSTLAIRSPQDTPAVINSATFLYNNSLYVFGGSTPSRLSNDMWKLDLDTRIWTLVNQGELKPLPQESMYYSFNDTTLYVYSYRKNQIQSLWKFNLTEQRWTEYTFSSTATESPLMYGGHAIINDHYFIIFSGCSLDINAALRAYRLDLSILSENNGWTEVPILNETNTSETLNVISLTDSSFVSNDDGTLGFLVDGIPSSTTIIPDYCQFMIRLNFTHSADNNNCFLTGTFYKNTVLIDSKPEYEYNEIVRSRHSAYYLSGSSILVFGGMFECEASRNDLLLYNISTFPDAVNNNTLSTHQKAVPCPRINHIFTTMRGFILIIGGRNRASNQILDGVHTYDIQERKWYIPYFRDLPPIEKAGYTKVHGSLFIYGGITTVRNGNQQILDKWYLLQCSSKNIIDVHNSDSFRYEQFLPPNVHSSTLIFHEHDLFIFSGQFLNDTHSSRPFFFDWSSFNWGFDYRTRFFPIDPMTLLLKGEEFDNIYLIGGFHEQKSMPHSILRSTMYHSNYTLTSNGYERFPMGLLNLNNSTPVKINDTLSIRLGGDTLGIAQKHLEGSKISTTNLSSFRGTWKEDFYLSGAKCSYYGRSIYCFGGNAVEDGVVINSDSNSLIEFKLNSSIFPCSPGYILNSSNNNSCDICPYNYYSTAYNSNSCSECPHGTFGYAFGNEQSDCCPNYPNLIGSYNSTSNRWEYIDCTEDQWCPLGSANNTNTKPSLLYNSSHQISNLQTPHLVGAVLPSIIVGGSIAIAAIVAFIIVCTPLKSHLYQVDSYSEAYSEKYDAHTHVATKHKKQTNLGGFLTIIAIGLVGGMMALQVYHLLVDLTETMMYTSRSLSETKDIIPHYQNKKITIRLTLHDYSGKCEEQNKTCSKELGIWKSEYDPTGLLLLFDVSYALYCFSYRGSISSRLYKTLECFLF